MMSPPTEAGTQAQAVEQLRALTRRASPTKSPELVAQPHAAGRRAEIGRGRRKAEAAMGRGYTMGVRRFFGEPIALTIGIEEEAVPLGVNRGSPR
jgi:hypothetical protein